MPINFDSRVALITGAGNGLGRAYAHLLASLGASVVVNDLGCQPDGSGASPDAADRVVAEIRDADGRAVADYHTVETAEGADGMVGTAVGAFGHLDILINNAGNIRHRLIEDLPLEDWDAVIRVHLTGSFNVTRAALAAMRERDYGRIVLTTSSFGLWGPIGLSPVDDERGERVFPMVTGRGVSSYGSAKMGMLGLMNAVKEEVRPRDIQINCIAPWSTSRLSTLPEETKRKLRPELTAPMVVYLCSDQCRTSGQVFVAGGGYYGRVAIVEGRGVSLDPARDISVDDVAANISRISDLSEWDEFPDPEGEGRTRILPNIGGM